MVAKVALTHDVKAGWQTHEGEPRWRTTDAALNRLAGAQVTWVKGVHKTHVASLVTDRKTISVIRYYPSHRRYSVRIEGFLFWGYNSILGYEMFKSVTQFTRVAEARKFARTILTQAGAIV